MSKCLKCGASDDWLCIDKIDTNMGYSESVESSGCLRRQLAAANEKLAESARLATESAQLADGLAKDLAAANERAGRLEDALRYYANPVVWSESYDHTYDCAWASVELDKGNIARKALEVPDAL